MTDTQLEQEVSELLAKARELEARINKEGLIDEVLVRFGADNGFAQALIKRLLESYPQALKGREEATIDLEAIREAIRVGTLPSDDLCIYVAENHGDEALDALMDAEEVALTVGQLERLLRNGGIAADDVARAIFKTDREEEVIRHMLLDMGAQKFLEAMQDAGIAHSDKSELRETLGEARSHAHDALTTIDGIIESLDA